MIEDYFKFAFAAITSRGTRSLLTIIGIMIGIAAIIALIAVGQGLQNAITQQFEKIGSNRLIITPGGIFMGPMGGGTLVTSKLTEDDLKIIERVKGVDIARGIFSRSAEVKFDDKTHTVTIIGSPTDAEAVKYMEKISFFNVETGRQLSLTAPYEAIIGNKLGSKIFNETINLGDKIEINGYSFKIVGIQSSSGTGTYDMIVRIPIDTARPMFNSTNEFSSIFASAAEGYNVSAVADEIKQKLRKYRMEAKGEETFSVQTTQQIVTSAASIIGIVQAVFVGIAAISLIVGGVGIMNSMYTSVLERTRQIGIMKSVGARNSDIMLIFVFESGMLGMLGGALGIIGGFGLSLIFNYVATNVANVSFQAVITPELVFGALAFAFIVGMASGFLPAQRAAGMKPADAMARK